MRIKGVVVNASPLICLSRSGLSRFAPFAFLLNRRWTLRGNRLYRVTRLMMSKVEPAQASPISLHLLYDRRYKDDGRYVVFLIAVLDIDYCRSGLNRSLAGGT